MAKKKKTDETAAQAADTSGGLRLTDHPRARSAIATAKGWGGLIGFAAGVFLASRAGVPTSDALLRGVEIGIGGYLVAWAGAVVLWRQIARAEIEQTRRMFIAAAERAEAEIERRRAQRRAQETRT